MVFDGSLDPVALTSGSGTLPASLREGLVRFSTSIMLPPQ
jgi:hypothetical protein